MSVILSILVLFSSTVDRIEVSGNEITRENVIRREVTFAPGDDITDEDIELTRIAIRKTGLFSNVDVHQVTVMGGPSVARIMVTEKRIPFPYPTIGIDQSSGWYAGLGVAYPNLLGRGLHFDVLGEIGFKVRTTPRWRAFASVFLPMSTSQWHGEKLVYDFTHLWRKDALIFKQEHHLYYRQDFRVYGPLYFSLQGGFIQTRGITNDTSMVAQPTFSVEGTDQSWYVRPTITLDMRDDSTNTRSGIYAVAFFGYNPGLSADFVTQRTCSLSVAGYLPLGEKTVLAGNVFTYQNLDSIPVYRTVYVGKDRFVRGWKDTTQVGSCLSVASIELRSRFFDVEIPILGGIPLWFGGSVNFDIGSIHEPGLPDFFFASADNNYDEGLLAATGFGIAAGTGNLVGKLELVYGIGSPASFPFSIPAYFGWRF